MSKIKPEELLELLPAYALDALTDAERREVEAWLAQDAEARSRLGDYQQVAGVLPLLVPRRSAPPALQARLMQRAQAAPCSARRVPRRWWAAAAGVLLLLGLGIALLRPAAVAPAALYAALTADTQARRIALNAHLDPATQGELVIAADGMQAVIRVEQLPPLLPEQAFQLWLVDDTGSVSGGVYRLEQPSAQYITVPLAKPADAYRRFGVSLEPAGGSPLGNRPSGPRVFDVTLSA